MVMPVVAMGSMYYYTSLIIYINLLYKTIDVCMCVATPLM